MKNNNYHKLIFCEKISQKKLKILKKKTKNRYSKNNEIITVE